MRKAINIDDLPAGGPVDQYGFPILQSVPVEALPGSTLAEMTNDYVHVKGRFWSKAMKLKQQKRIASLGSTLSGIADPVVIMDTIAAMALLLLYVEEGEGYRPATLEEVEEDFDMLEAQALVSKLTGMSVQGVGSKN